MHNKIKCFFSLLLSLTFPSIVFAQPAPETLSRAAPSIVRVAQDLARTLTKIGNGVVVSTGIVVTPCNITRGDRTLIDWQNHVYPAEVVKSDKSHALCQLKVKDLPAPPVILGTSSPIVRGQPVYTVGAIGQYRPVILSGVVIDIRPSRNANLGNLLRISNRLPPQVRGGGLFNTDGRLIGIVGTSKGISMAMPTEWLVQMGLAR